jgi:hypothetical protein
MTAQPMAPSPANPDTGRRVVRVGALVVIGLVVLCGLLGSCLFAFTLVAPLITGRPTP